MDDEYCSCCGNHLRDGCCSDTVEQSNKDAGRAVLLGLLTQEGGSLYTGKIRKWIGYQVLIGVVFLIAVAILFSLFGTRTDFGGGTTPIVFLLLIILEGIYIYALYDGCISAKKNNPCLDLQPVLKMQYAKNHFAQNTKRAKAGTRTRVKGSTVL